MTSVGDSRQQPDRPEAPPSRVALLRALKLGDLLCAVPVFRALRAAWPRARLVLVGLPWARTLVERYRAYLDEFRDFPGYPGLPEQPPQFGRIPSFLAEMQAEQFDLAVQLHGNGRVTNPLTALFGARQTAGFYAPGDWCPDRERFRPWPEDGLEVRRLLGILECLRVAPAGEHLEFPLTSEDFEKLSALDTRQELIPGRYICLHAGASVAERRWPPECFAAVADALASRGFRIVLTGTGGEVVLTRTVARAMQTPALDFAGRTDLGVAAALVHGARLVICNDTGISHLAAALRVPSVVLSTANQRDRWAPADQHRHRTLCRRPGVSAEAVIAAAEDLLRTHASARREADVRPLALGAGR